MKIFNALILCFSVFVNISVAQVQKSYGKFSDKEAKKVLKAARKETSFGNYSAAQEKYSDLLKSDSTNVTYNYEQALVLYNNFLQPKSIPFFEKAIQYSKDTIGDAYYFLANAYHLSAKFDIAQKYYRIYLSLLENDGTDLMPDEEKALKEDIKHRIEMCDNGKKLYQSPHDKFTLNGKTHSFQIVDAGKNVNGIYDDYDAVISANDSVMYFTSRREGTTGGKIDWDDKYFEDIYVSGLGNNGWGKSFNIDAPINTKKHEAVIGMSPDGKTIFFYRGVKQGTFYYSNLVGGTWTKPREFGEKTEINSKAWETSFYGFTIAGTELYVVSDREGGIGGRDIYVSKKQSDGTWGPLADIGNPINTQYDEDAPFITSDGKTMYFSSQGHNSMGGFDIFKSDRKADGTWSEPVNLGVPFNTPGNDIYFIIANKRDQAFYSSSAGAKDSTQDMDIYSIDLCDDVSETTLSGLALGIPTGTITVTDKGTGKDVGSFKIDNEKYSMQIQHGKDYRFTLNIPAGIKPVSIDVSIPYMCKVHELYQELEFPQPGQPLVVRNAFFDIKKEAASAGISNYSEFLKKMDKSSVPMYNETSVPTTAVVLAKVDTAKTSASSVNETLASAVSSQSITATKSSESESGKNTSAASTTSTKTTTKENGATSTVTTISFNNILFDFNKSNLKPEFTAELDKVVDFLKHVNKKAKIEVAGHTDSKGSAKYNLALSKRRANAVSAYLVSKGVNSNRIKAIGYGASKPVAVNENPDGSDNPDGRAKNRRTEIIIIQ